MEVLVLILILIQIWRSRKSFLNPPLKTVYSYLLFQIKNETFKIIRIRTFHTVSFLSFSIFCSTLREITIVCSSSILSCLLWSHCIIHHSTNIITSFFGVIFAWKERKAKSLKGVYEVGALYLEKYLYFLFVRSYLVKQTLKRYN